MNAFKILVTGAVGSGKTTFVRTASDIDPVTTEAGSQETPGKTQTTVALDYGRLRLDDHMLHLFGTPGQERFNYMWETLSEGVDGMVALVHAGQDDAAARTDHLINTIGRVHAIPPFVVGLTHTDGPGANPSHATDAAFADAAADVMPFDARQTEKTHAVLRRLLSELA